MKEPNAVDKFIRISPQTHMFEPVWMHRDIMSFSLGPDPSIIAQNSAIPLTSVDAFTVPYKLPHASIGMDDSLGNPLSINQITFMESLLGTSSAAFTVFMTDLGDQRQFMNFPIHVRTFAGSGQLSARLAEDLFLPTRHQLNISFQKTASAENQSLRLYMFGRKYYTWSTNLQSHMQDRANMLEIIRKALEKRKYVFPYWMTTDQGVVNVPANQTVENDALVGSEGHFECTHIMRAFTGGSATNAPFEVELINPQTRQSLMNGRIHSYLIGDAFNPQPFPAPFIIPAGQLLRFRITDLSGSANKVYLTLRGRKIRSDFKSIEQVEKDFGIKKPKVK